MSNKQVFSNEVKTSAFLKVAGDGITLIYLLNYWVQFELSCFQNKAREFVTVFKIEPRELNVSQRCYKVEAKKNISQSKNYISEKA